MTFVTVFLVVLSQFKIDVTESVSICILCVYVCAYVHVIHICIHLCTNYTSIDPR